MIGSLWTIVVLIWGIVESCSWKWVPIKVLAEHWKRDAIKPSKDNIIIANVVGGKADMYIVLLYCLLTIESASGWWIAITQMNKTAIPRMFHPRMRLLKKMKLKHCLDLSLYFGWSYCNQLETTRSVFTVAPNSSHITNEPIHYSVRHISTHLSGHTLNKSFEVWPKSNFTCHYWYYYYYLYQ